MRIRIFCLMFSACALVMLPVLAGEVRSESLVAGFNDPPDSARPGVYWYISGM